MSDVYDVADRYTRDYLALDPAFATLIGVTDHDDDLTDYSPEGIERRSSLRRDALASMHAAQADSERDRVAKAVFVERVSQQLTHDEAGESLRDLSVIWSPAQHVRTAFDLLPRESGEQWQVLCRRMEKVPEALVRYRQALVEGTERRLLAARRQAIAVAREARTIAGVEAGSTGYFAGIVDQYINRPDWDRKLEGALRQGAAAAGEAYDHLARFLVDEYAPRAPDDDAIGPERYAMCVNRWLGADVNVLEAYEWGWDELRRVRGEIRSVCDEIVPGAGYGDVIEQLNQDHERTIQGEAALMEWLHALLATAVDRLDGSHFDIPAPIREIDVRIAPPGTAAAQYYTFPSDDLTRHGTYWYPTLGRTEFPMWNEISTAYHEGVPGHHLQMGYLKCLTDELSSFQRTLVVPGHGEGWALYAERLMDELGFLERPEFRLDMLSNSLFRAARVVVDIGLHLKLRIPMGEDLHSGEMWSPDIAREFMSMNAAQPPAFIASEIDRYLGLPGQAIAYKLGEKVWLEARAEAKARQGPAFSLKEFHMRALTLGPMGLDQMKVEIGAF